MARFGVRALWPAGALGRAVFRDETARSLFASSSIHAILPPTHLFTAAFGLIFGALGMTRGWPVAKGGSGAITAALASVLAAHGGRIHLDHEVTDLREFDSWHPWAVEADQAIDLALACEQAGRDFDPRLENSDGASVGSGSSLSVYANSHGFVGRERSTQHSLGCALIAGRGEDMQRDGWYSVALAADELESAATIGRKAAERAVSRLADWAVVALLHDFDYERYPDQENHPFRGVEILTGKGYPEWVTRAILSHADYSGVPRESRLEHALFACDEMAGFVTAASLVRPSKSAEAAKSLSSFTTRRSETVMPSERIWKMSPLYLARKSSEKDRRAGKPACSWCSSAAARSGASGGAPAAWACVEACMSDALFTESYVRHRRNRGGHYVLADRIRARITRGGRPAIHDGAFGELTAHRANGVGVDRSGHAVTVWSVHDGANYRIQARRRSSSGGLSDSMTSRARM